MLTVNRQQHPDRFSQFARQRGFEVGDDLLRRERRAGEMDEAKHEHVLPGRVRSPFPIGSIGREDRVGEDRAVVQSVTVEVNRPRRGLAVGRGENGRGFDHDVWLSRRRRPGEQEGQPHDCRCRHKLRGNRQVPHFGRSRETVMSSSDA
jgi:hypothetical protein